MSEKSVLDDPNVVWLNERGPEHVSYASAVGEDGVRRATWITREEEAALVRAGATMKVTLS